MCGIAAGMLVHGGDGLSSILEVLVPAINAVRHRESRGTGYAYYDPAHAGRVLWHKSDGDPTSAFAEMQARYAPGGVRLAMAQVRYATEGNGHVTSRDQQPAVVESARGTQFALVLNGNQPRYHEIKRALEKQGYEFTSNNEVEMILRVLVRTITEVDQWQSNTQVVIDAIHGIMDMFFDGAFSAVFMFKDNLFVFRDRHGFRPLCVGQGDGYVLAASETCSLDVNRIPFDKQFHVQPGAIVHITSHGEIDFYQDDQVRRVIPRRACAFEDTYFQGVNSRTDAGGVIYDHRVTAGRLLVADDREAGFFNTYQPDIVIAAPDSANPYAYGYAQGSGIPYNNTALVRNHGVGRSFITDGDTDSRLRLLRMKLQPMEHILRGKSVVLVDDSIVRGTTIRYLLFLLVETGVREIHLRIGSPPITHGCSWGIRIEADELAMINHTSVQDFEGALTKAVCGRYHLDGFVLTLRHLSLEVFERLLSPKTHCLHCFTGVDPIKRNRNDE